MFELHAGVSILAARSRCNVNCGISVNCGTHRTKSQRNAPEAKTFQGSPSKGPRGLPG